MSINNGSNGATFPNDLIGKFRQIGTIGPAYEILGAGAVLNGLPAARIKIIESGEETAYPIADILKDPEPV